MSQLSGTCQDYTDDLSCILIFTISAANSDQYIATRTLYGMAKDGNAPKACLVLSIPEKHS